jgi:hypothetical protein
VKQLNKQDTELLKGLVEIGKDAAVGKICNRCGREFRKAIGRIRTCKKCVEGGAE